ncbi:MAG: hypothetical protein H6Q52_922 [Deltaproteobacteria bacterium]|nr:hypothetical protein [Deltaproteobacteria bacterium]
MGTSPLFPDFKPVEINDRQSVIEILRSNRPGTSELTFTNLFIWRNHYNFRWCLHNDCLCVIGEENSGPEFAMAPVGPSGRIEAAAALLEWLKGKRGVPSPAIERADEGLALEASRFSGLIVEERREHFDYVYLTRELIDLPGNRNRNKRNHINQFFRAYESYVYEELNERHIEAALGLQEKWCLLRRCEEDLNLLGEWDAIREILNNYRALEVAGAVIVVGGEVKAFTLGEPLSGDMALIHIEKADPGIPGLYQLINQQFCARRWNTMKFINREQDLGIPGLREAKLSYNPDHFIKKYSISLRG